MKTFFEILIIFLGSVNLLLAWPVLIGLRQPTTLPLWMIKVFTTAATPVLFIAGVTIGLLGLVIDSYPSILIGSLSALLFLVHIIKVIQPPDAETGFEKAFGPEWLARIPGKSKAFFLKKRYVILLPNSRGPVFTKNISFYTIPGSTRDLLCDLWEPREKTKRSGLAFIYLHGSAWTSLDKDFGTRNFFRHLVNQGHVVMDVAYRLFPETDFMGMIHDAKHAIAWMKVNAAGFGVNPECIVIGGGSAGAHIALLAAYTGEVNQLIPADLESVDLGVRAVVSWYGQADLSATYYHTCQHLTTHSALAQKKNDGAAGMPSWIRKSIGEDYHRLGFDKNVEPGMLVPMLGGNPDEKPEAYSLFSPLTYVNKDCPPTLILHGKQDILAPVEAIRRMYSRLKEVNVPVVMHLFPQTDHAFDLILTKISPSAQNAIYDVERFLALMAGSKIAKRKKVMVYQTSMEENY